MNDALATLMLVAFGGGVGGVARFWLADRVDQRVRSSFPWGTLLVNVSGATGIGALAGILPQAIDQNPVQAALWHALAIGVLGSYTTVSSFSLQTLALFRAGQHRAAALNVLASMGLCLTAAATAYAATLALVGAHP